MDCAAMGTECTAAHQGQRSGVVAGECATRTNHARENPQCNECAIQPCTPLRSLRWQPYPMGAPKRQTPYCSQCAYDCRGTASIGSATAARKNPGVLGRKHRTATERTVRSAMA